MDWEKLQNSTDFPTLSKQKLFLSFGSAKRPTSGRVEEQDLPVGALVKWLWGEWVASRKAP